MLYAKVRDHQGHQVEKYSKSYILQNPTRIFMFLIKLLTSFYQMHAQQKGFSNIVYNLGFQRPKLLFPQFLPTVKFNESKFSEKFSFEQNHFLLLEKWTVLTPLI